MTPSFFFQLKFRNLVSYNIQANEHGIQGYSFGL